MLKTGCKAFYFKGLNSFFEVVMEGSRGLVLLGITVPVAVLYGVT